MEELNRCYRYLGTAAPGCRLRRLEGVSSFAYNRTLARADV